MKFQLWKNEHKAGDNPSWYTFSFKRKDAPAWTCFPTRFSDLFPDFDTNLIPQAPETINVELTLKEVKKRDNRKKV